MKLNEWQYINKPAGNSGGYKKRFEKLIKYHIDHASSELERIIRKDIKEDSFHLGEHYNTGTSEFDRDIVVSVDKNTDTFFLSVFVDGKEVLSTQCNGYETLVEILDDDYMYLTYKGTADFDELISESLNEWKYINPPAQQAQAAASHPATKTNKEKFKELTDYMIKNKSSNVNKAEVVRLDDGGFTYKEYRKSPSGQDVTFTLLVGYSRFGPQWKYALYMDTNLEDEKSGNGFNYLLFELYKYFKVPNPGSPEHESICESASFAEDFKLYENLWD